MPGAITLCSACGGSLPYVSVLSSSEKSMSRLRLGYVPCTSDEESIGAETAQAETQLERVNAAVVLISSVLEQLLEAWNELCTAISCSAGLSEPVRRLPLEILELAFSNCIQRNAISNRNEEPCVLPTLCLSQVNHRWRCVTFNMPSIWTNMALVIGGHSREIDPPGFNPIVRPLLEMYLRLSSSQPLQVQICSDPRNHRPHSLLPRDRVLLQPLVIHTASLQMGVVSHCFRVR